MIEIKHARATFKVKPEHAPAIHDLLVLIDKTKGKRGSKMPKRTDPKFSAVRRDYPVFNPRVMLTSDYVTAYMALNHARLHLTPCNIEPMVNRTPPGYDPQFPVCVEEVLE